MGILETSKPVVTSPTTRRKSGLDFGSLKPLNAATGTKNFGGYRDGAKSSPKAKNKSQDAMDSDADDEDDAKIEDADEEKDALDKGLLSPEDAAKQGELAEGVRKIKVSQIQPAARRLSKLTTPPAKTPALGRAAPARASLRLNIGITALRHARTSRSLVVGHHDDDDDGNDSGRRHGDRRERRVAVQKAPRQSAGLRQRRAQEPGSGAGRRERARKLGGHGPYCGA